MFQRSILSLTVAALCFVAPAAEAAPTRVGLVRISASDRVTAKITRKATRRLLNRLRRSRAYRVVYLPVRKAAAMRRCLQSVDCVKTVAGRYGVRYLVVAHAERTGRRVHLDMRVVSGVSGLVLASKSFGTRSFWRLLKASSAMAFRLLRKARTGVKVASADSSATDVQFAPEPVEKSAPIIEVRDGEDPNAPKAVATIDVPAIAPGGAPAAANDPAVMPMSLARDDQGLVKRLWQRRYWQGWASASVGIVALSAATIFGSLSAKANKDARETELQVDAWTLRDQARKNAMAANIMFAVGGAALLTSAITFCREYKRETRELRSKGDMTFGVNVAKGGGGISMQGRF